MFAGQGYSNAVSSVPSIGEGLASFIELLVQQGVDLSKVHLIGFDLGAHVIGFTGRQLHGKVARITGKIIMKRDSILYVPHFHS